MSIYRGWHCWLVGLEMAILNVQPQSQKMAGNDTSEGIAKLRPYNMLTTLSLLHARFCADKILQSQYST